MRILICEDEAACALDVAALCEDFLMRNGIEAEILMEANAERITAHSPDIVLLDIEMPGVSGVEAKDMLCKEDRKPLIIFVSSHSEMMLTAFGRNVISFIPKPVQQFALDASLKTAVDLLPKDTKVKLVDGKTVNCADIAYIVVQDVYTDIYFVNGKIAVNQRRSLSAWEELLHSAGFLRISDRHLVNCAYVEEIKGESAILEHNLGVLHISRRRKATCKEFYRNYCRRMAKMV